MRITEKANLLEKRINAYIHGLPSLRMDTYFFYLMWLFFITGLTLFVYALVFDINIILIGMYSNPIFHTGLGFCCALCYLGVRWGARHGV